MNWNEWSQELPNKDFTELASEPVMGYSPRRLSGCDCGPNADQIQVSVSNVHPSPNLDWSQAFCERSHARKQTSLSSPAHCRRSRRSCASATTALAKTRAALSAPDGKRRGCKMVGLAGHLTMTTA